MSFANLCQLGIEAKQLARRLGIEAAARYLRSWGVAIQDAIAMLMGVRCIGPRP